VVNVECARVGPVQGSRKMAARAVAGRTRARDTAAAAELELELEMRLPQPGSWTTVAVAGGVVMFPKNGTVPVAILKVVAESDPLATWNVPRPPAMSEHASCSEEPRVRKRMSMALGSMLVLDRTWARRRSGSVVSVSPVSGAYP
jgi:hypothetical protein